MTQIVFFLTEHAEELFVLLCSAYMVFLLATLHRMKQISKLIQEIAGNTNEIKRRLLEDQTLPQTAWQTERAEGCAYTARCMPEEVAENVQKDETADMAEKLPEERETAGADARLLSEVLGEVFP